MDKKTTWFVLLLFLLFMPQSVDAQCKITNNAFASGEDIHYDLYFNYGILKARAGRGSLSVTEANYRGLNSLKMEMMLNTSGLAGSVYSVNDTLTSYVDMDLRPLLFTKEAFEGNDYSVESQAYTYDGDEVSIRVIRSRNGKEKFDEVVTTDQCTYDYLSVLSLIRNLDYTGLEPGDRKYIQFISGKKAVDMYVNYLGISSVKANDGNTYEVIDISMTIQDDAFDDPKDALRASLTNDENHVPIIIDTRLKIGSVRAVLRTFTGLRN